VPPFLLPSPTPPRFFEKLEETVANRFGQTGKMRRQFVGRFIANCGHFPSSPGGRFAAAFHHHCVGSRKWRVKGMNVGWKGWMDDGADG
jgi:hypothetical protein